MANRNYEFGSRVQKAGNGRLFSVITISKPGEFQYGMTLYLTKADLNALAKQLQEAKEDLQYEGDKTR